MREILFRGKRIYDGKWIYGNLVVDKSMEPHIVPHDFFFEDGHHLVYDDETDNPVFIFKDSVGQYTGLKDRNGKRIFEGDVIHFSLKTRTEYYVVEWYNGGFVFRDVKIRAIGNDLVQSDADNAEIVRNIHDNPDLLK